jgi:hypothetical protein
MIRKCVVCGKNIKIRILNKKGNYDGGHYFGKMKIPVGKGKYKKVGTTKLLKKKVNVVNWTGKEKEVEYWECNKCYEEAMHENWLEEIIGKLYGKRCKDYEAGCPCCEAWNIFDTIIEENRGKL